ncbi:hypothetical protein DFJ74DRAFT_668382 [Hyaloraphidium curvatum]|nr:hypothetical protein DFJ74DRAFT_668382 [Hyaloraphidium curvatum]
MDAPLDLREDEPKAYLQELRFSFGALRSERVQGADPLATLPRYLTPFPDTLDAPVDRPHALEPFHPAPFAEYAPVEASHADLGLIPPPTAWNTLEEPLLLAKPVEKRWNVSTPLEPMPPRSPPSLFRRVDEELAMPKVSKAVFATLMSVLDGFQPSSDSDHDCHLELLLRDTLQAPPTNSAVEFDLPLLPTPADRSIKSFVISKSKRSTSPARYESPSSILYRYLPDAVFAITKDSLPQQAQASVLEPFRSDVSAEFDVQSLEASLLSALAGTEHAVKFRSLDLPVFPNDSDLLKLRGKDWLAEIPLAPFEATPALPDGLRAFLDQAPRSEQALEPFNVSSSCPAFLAPTLPTPPTIEPVPWDAWVEHFLAKMSLSRLFPTRSIAVSLSRQPWASFIRLTSVIDDMPPHQLPQMPSLSVDEFVGTIVSQMPPFEPIDHELDAEEPPPYRAPGPSPKRQRTEAYLPEGPAIADRSVERTAKASSRITLPNIEPPKQPEDQATSFLSSISDFIRLRGKTAPGLVQPAAAQANSKVRHAPANPQAPAEPAEIHTEDRAEPLESHSKLLPTEISASDRTPRAQSDVQQPPTPLQLPSRAVADTSAVQHDTPQPWTCLASPQVVDNQALLRCLENDHNIVVVAADWTGQPDLVLSDSVAVYVIDGYDLTQRSERDSSALLDAVCGEEHRPFGGPVLNRIASAAHKYANLAVLVDFSGERGGLSSREEATPRDSFVPPTQLGLASLAALGSALCSVGTLFTAMLCSSPGEAATAIRTIIDTVCIGQRMPSASGNTSAAEKWLDQLGLFNPLEVKELLVGNSLGQLCAGALPQSAEENQFALKIEALISLLNAKLV